MNQESNGAPTRKRRQPGLSSLLWVTLVAAIGIYAYDRERHVWMLDSELFNLRTSVQRLELTRGELQFDLDVERERHKILETEHNELRAHIRTTKFP
jgi:hypothetical protein